MEINLSSFNDIRTYFFVPLKLMNFSQYPHPHPQIYFGTLFVGLIQTNHIPQYSPFLVLVRIPLNRHIVSPTNTNIIPQYCHVEPFYFLVVVFQTQFFFFFDEEMGEYLIYLCVERCWQYSRWMNQKRLSIHIIINAALWFEMCKDSRSLYRTTHSCYIHLCTIAYRDIVIVKFYVFFVPWNVRISRQIDYYTRWSEFGVEFGDVDFWVMIFFCIFTVQLNLFYVFMFEW